MRYFIAIVTVLFLATTGHASTWYVPDDYGTIQAAINASVNGDTIIVRSGTYVGNINFLGKAITLASEEGPEKTVIDGSNEGSVVTFDSSEGPNSVLDGFTVTNGSGNASGGFTRGGGIYCLNSSSPTITNNIITGNHAYYGGGIYPRFDSSPLIENNFITGNSADYGGGILCHGSSPTIKGNTISGNSAQNEGGGIVGQYSSSPTIQDNIITGNWAYEFGGGIEILHDCSATIENNTITYNTAQTNGSGGIGLAYDCTGTINNNTIAYNSSKGTLWCGGGIIVSDNSSVTITNNCIYKNSSTTGGGIDVYQNSVATISNNTIHGNTASYAGGGIACRQSSSAVVTNTILWCNESTTGPEIFIGYSSSPSTVTTSYSDISGGHYSQHVDPGCIFNWGTGMIDIDPIFVDPVNGDYHLTYPSPCRDTGDNTVITELYDFEGDPRIAWNGTADMGADEFYTHFYITGDKTPGGAIEGKFIGLPGTTPVALFVGSGVLPSPMNTMWGGFWLDAPWFLFGGPLGAIPSDGVMVLSTTLPVTIPAPYDVPMQALIGLNSDSLTNLYVLEVR